ncbi:carcinine hydrolase/isopenicillin-N N-acyltransferase family protein [Dysgonomonas sp. HGC4]|uniref:carcinine hydrolase/isopenicillin-N N-acyltransferase family protein n=1 Tax=Dysgonomonas sp. HGC4 TaxID=1658009 RepID=UPI0009E4302B|nr:carcinine hydrolase/isopenicillin-N N-acyltransferase family protein [Dysgonomonas sp. HGC4]MBD8347982.1 acyl-CoA--6-aminopenicillanic acid acyl-transferase [Dysgonomonas sp. HGC4]
MKHFKALILLIIVLALYMHSIDACTIFIASNGKSTFVGNNEDYVPGVNSYLWVRPAENNKYGYVFWGFEEMYPEGGMNEYGLFFDAAALPEKIAIVKDSSKPDYEGYLVEKILSSCYTVEEAVQLLQSFNLTWQEKAQIMVADKNGDYAVIHANYIIRKKDPLFVLTNYSLQNKATLSTNCWRRETAYELLNSKALTTGLIKEVLLETAQKASDNATVYSQVCDLRNGTIQVYQNHDFSISKEIKVKDILDNGKQDLTIKSLFPLSIADTLSVYLQDKTKEETIGYYKYLRENDKGSFNFSESELDRLGYELIDSSRISEAIAIFKLNWEYFPESDMVHASLANAYLVNKEYNNADQLYSITREMNPHNIYVGLFGGNDGEVTFRIRGLSGAKKIVLVGTFNNNDTQSDMFEKQGNDWVYKTKLPKGEYTYKLYVDDMYWMEDPDNKLHKNQGEWWDSLLIVR